MQVREIDFNICTSACGILVILHCSESLGIVGLVC